MMKWSYGPDESLQNQQSRRPSISRRVRKEELMQSLKVSAAFGKLSAKRSKASF
jgi:hypothetical protein